MKKMGFSKKSDGDDDSNRSGLFGRKKSAAQEENPYAQQPAEDPYAKKTPYQQARTGLPGGPRPGGAGGGLPSGPGPRGGGPPPPYSNSPQPGGGSGGGYGAEKLGATGGYGANRYDSGSAPAYGQRPSPAPSRGPTRGPGGYGGLGRNDSSATDDNRDALFSGAQARETQRYETGGDDRYGQGQSGATGGSYDGYGVQRELTEQEQEQEDVRGMSRQIRDVRQESVRTLDRSLAMADQAIETSLGTYARLGAQGERLYNTEKNLDLAANQSRIASEKASELKTLNRSMFAVHVSNPFTSGKRAAQRDQDVLDKHRDERDRREATRKDAFAANQRMESSFKDIGRPPQGLLGLPKTSAAERSKHLFVDDDDDPDLAAEDERDEEAIDSKLADLHGRVGMLNTIGRRMGEEVDSQIVHIKRIEGKSDAVDDGVRMNREQLNRIR